MQALHQGRSQEQSEQVRPLLHGLSRVPRGQRTTGVLVGCDRWSSEMTVVWAQEAILVTDAETDTKGEGTVMFVSRGRTISQLPGKPGGRNGGPSDSTRAPPS